MSLKDILNSVTGRNRALKPTESAPPAALPSDSFPILRASEVDLNKYEKLPLSGLAALGAAFATLPEAARTIVQTVTNGVDTGEMLFTAINPKGATGFLRMGEYGTSGNIVNSKGRYTGSLYFKPVENVPLMQTTTTVMPFDPATVAVAVALMRIEEKLDALQKTAEETLQRRIAAMMRGGELKAGEQFRAMEMLYKLEKQRGQAGEERVKTVRFEGALEQWSR